jgi:very-short-patch-repair endonuclease
MTASVIGSTNINDDISALPPADVLLWSKFCENMPPHLRFSRDIIVGEHIISLCCRSAKVAVEFDLPPEEGRTAEDIARLHALEERHYTILSFRSEEIYNDVDAVHNTVILAALKYQEATLKKHKEPALDSANLSHRPSKRRIA